MTSTPAYPDQLADFVAAATRALAFLEDAGYALGAVGEDHVTYVSPRASVRLVLGPTSDLVLRMLHLSLRRTTSDRWHAADEIGVVRWIDGDVEASRALRAATRAESPDELRRGVERIATVLREHLAEELAGDVEAWDRIELAPSEARRAAELSNALHDGIPKARAAFASGDYAHAVAILAPLEPHLPPAERKRLDIARRRSA